jgi:two-component sensor histidine kinase/PAS domain-containing protein
MKQTAHKSLAGMVIGFILLLAAGLLLWHAVIRIQDFDRHQQELVQHSVAGAAKEITTFIRDRRLAVSMFADNNTDLIRYLAENPTDYDTRRQLEGKVAEHFPQYFAMTIADKSGEPLLGNFELLVNERCEQDIRDFVANNYDYDVYIHPHTEAYHFDIMTPWQAANGVSGIFFVSFKPEILARMLRNAQIHRHELILLRQDVPGLIEISAGGARDELPQLQGEFVLDAEQLQAILYSQPVQDSRWLLVDRPSPTLFPEQHNKIWAETLILFAAFAGISMLLLWLLKREEHRRLQSEGALREAKEQLQHALDFSDVSTWELDIPRGEFRWSDNAVDIFHSHLPASLQEYLQMVSADDRQRIQSAISECKEQGTACHLEHRLQLDNGNEHWVELTGNLEPFKKEDPDKMIGLIMDVTTRKRAEQDRLAAEKAHQQTLVREVHHRIKNNLQGVVGLLKGHAKRDPGSRQTIDLAISQLYSMSAVYGLQCNDQQGAINLVMLLQEICRSTMAMTGCTIKYAGVTGCSQDFVISSDNAVAVALILNELLFNAVKHSMDVLNAQVSMQLHCEQDEAMVLIRNSGSRLPSGFDFINNRGLGTGLGLVRSLLPRQGARLNVYNEQNAVLAQLLLRPPVLRKGDEDDTSNLYQTQSAHTGS